MATGDEDGQAICKMHRKSVCYYDCSELIRVANRFSTGSASSLTEDVDDCPVDGRPRAATSGSEGSGFHRAASAPCLEKTRSTSLDLGKTAGKTVPAKDPRTSTRESLAVAIRVRPLVARDKAAGASDVLRVACDGRTVSLAEDSSVKPRKTRKSGAVPEAESATLTGWTFDYVFDSREGNEEEIATQEQIFESFGKRVVEGALAGVNGCLFAYGQTGAGKTHTVVGHSASPQERGLLPRILENLFDSLGRRSGGAERGSVKASFIEVYNETIRDLLVPPASGRENTLSVKYTASLGVVINDLTEQIVTSIDDALELVDFGMKMRSIAATAMNSRSSRAHTVFTFRLEQDMESGETTMAQVQVVDLAGREQERKSGYDQARLRERAFINTSLFHLSSCILSISRSVGGRLPDFTFRNSKLTMVLANALSKNCRTAMIAAVSPAAADADETLSTLRFASTVKQIRTQVSCNSVDKRSLVQKLQKEIEALKDRAGADDRQEVDNLQAVIEQYRGDLQNMEAKVHAKEAQLQRRTYLEDLGLHVGGDSVSLQERGAPFLVNISEDPFLEGSLVYFLKPSEDITVGNAPGSRICLGGLGIEPEHCTLRCESESSECVLLRLGWSSLPPTASSVDDYEEGVLAAGGPTSLAPRILLNGRRVTKTEELRHQDVLFFGHAFSFRLAVPAVARAAASSTPRSHLSADGAEPEPIALAAVKRLFPDLGGAPRVELAESFSEGLALVEEANLIASELRPEQGFEFRLQALADVLAPPSFSCAPSLAVVVVAALEGQQGKEGEDRQETARLVWSLEKFRCRLVAMRDLYEEFRLGRRDLEALRRRLRREPHRDPWLDAGLAEMQLLLQGLGAGAAEPPSPGSTTDDDSDGAVSTGSSGESGGTAEATCGRWYCAGRRRSRDLVAGAAAASEVRKVCLSGAPLNATPELRNRGCCPSGAAQDNDWQEQRGRLRGWGAELDAKEASLRQLQDDLRRLSALDDEPSPGFLVPATHALGPAAPQDDFSTATELERKEQCADGETVVWTGGRAKRSVVRFRVPNVSCLSDEGPPCEAVDESGDARLSCISGVSEVWDLYV